MLFDLFVLVGLGSFAILAGLAMRWRVLKRTGRIRSGLSDADVSHIVETGHLAVDDSPLDMEEAREAEERFWSESWDEPQSEW